MPKNLKNSFMLNRIKGLLKVQLKDYNWPLGLMALVQIFKGPTNTILNCSALNETILIFVNTLHDQFLESIGSHFGKKLQPHASERDRPIITHFLR